MHERYSGPLKYRITVIGNQTFSGLYSIAWSPRRIQGNAVVISELQKYAYESKAIALPENGCYLLHDARKNNFYREVDDADDIDARPHLVVFVHMTAVSPLREGITIRIRVASCLADGSEGAGTFQVALPRLMGQTPGISNQPTGSSDTLLQRLSGSSLIPIIIRPLHAGVSPFRCVLEGNIFQQQIPAISDYILTNWEAPKWIDTEFAIREEPYHFFTRMTFLSMSKKNTSVNPNLIKGNFWAFVSFDRITGMDDTSPLITKCVQAFNKHTDNNDTSEQFISTFMSYVGDAVKVYQYTRSIIVTSDKTVSFNNGIVGAKMQFPLAEGKPRNEFIVYTDKGPIYLLAMDFDQKTDVEYVTNNGRVQTDEVKNFINKATQITNLNLVDETDGMPAGWMNCIFTADKPKPVNAPIRSYININHVSLKTLISFIAPNIRDTECLQFVLSDLDSGGSVMTCRYLADRNAVVVNVGTALDKDIYYYICNRPLASMYISSISVIPRVNTFPLTDLRAFIDNTITGRGEYNAGAEEDVQPNAGMILGSIAGGGLSGIGQGVTDAVNNQWKRTENWRDRDLAKWLAEYKGGQMSDMQKQQLEAIMNQMQKQFGYNQQLQQNQFDFQREMAGGQWGQQSRMQQAGFDQATQMQQQDFLNAQENAILGQEMAGYRTPSQAYAASGSSTSGTKPPGGEASSRRSSTSTSSGGAGSSASSLPGYDESDMMMELLGQSLESSSKHLDTIGKPSYFRRSQPNNELPIDEEYIGDTASEYSTASSGAGSYSSASSGLSGPRETPKNDSFLHGPANPQGKNESFLHSNPYAQQRAPSTSSPKKSGRPNTIRVGGARPAWRGGNTIKIKN